MKRQEGEVIAIKAVEWLAGDADNLGRFLAATGISLDEVRSRIGDPEFLAAVLDHILGSERDVTEFARHAGISAEKPMLARATLPGGDAPHWT